MPDARRVSTVKSPVINADFPDPTTIRINFPLRKAPLLAQICRSFTYTPKKEVDVEGKTVLANKTRK